jgi:hypothetical protein
MPPTASDRPEHDGRMSSHAAYRPDSDLLPRAAAGDGAAALVLLERHGARLRRGALDQAGDHGRAGAAVAATFAALLGGTLRPAPGAGLAWLQAAVAAQAEALAAPLPDDATGTAGDDLVAALAERLPPAQGAALLAAHRADVAPGDPPPLPAPEVPFLPPAANGPVALEVIPPTPEELRRAVAIEDQGARTLATGRRAATPPGKSLDRYIERPSPLRWIAPLALVAALVALWSWWQYPGREGLESPFPAPRDGFPTAVWPTLPPRVTRPVALQPPSPEPAPTEEEATATPAPEATATAAPPTVAAPTATRPAPAATATATRPPQPTATKPPVAAAPPTATTAPPTATRPAPTATATTAATATATTSPATPSATATTPPTEPPWLVLATESLDFGVEVGPRTLSFVNSSGTPLTWHLVADNTWLEFGQDSGTVPPGGSQSVAVSIARGDLPTGAYDGVIQVVSDGGEGLVPVTMTVSPSNTTISAFAAPTAPIGVLGCAEPITYPVSADIGGTRPPQKATLYFSLNGGTQRTKELLPERPGRYSAILGPFTEPGAVLYALVITEADGTIVRSASYTLQVNGCPTRVQTVPVVPPVTQPFALGGGGHMIYTFPVVQPGTLQVSLRWRSGAQRLSTLLYGPRHADQPYEQRTGVGSLGWTFPVTEEDVAAGGTWALHLVNYETIAADGTFELTFTPLGQPLPTPAPTRTPAPTPSPTPTASPTAAPTRPTNTPGPPRPATPGTP